MRSEERFPYWTVGFSSISSAGTALTRSGLSWISVGFRVAVMITVERSSLTRFGTAGTPVK